MINANMRLNGQAPTHLVHLLGVVPVHVPSVDSSVELLELSNILLEAAP